MASFPSSAAIFLALLLAAIFLALFFGVMKYLSYYSAPLALDNCGLSPPDLPVELYSHKEIGCLLECAVCLAEFEEGEKVKVIPVCGHLFHPTCIDRWFVSNCSCPLCRQSFEIPVASMV